MILKTPIYGTPLMLRTLESEDASQKYLDWLSDTDVSAFLEVRYSPPRSLKDLEAAILKANQSSHSLLLGIFLIKNKSHIGNVKLGPINWQHKVADIGFLIGDKQHWGKGYASKAIRLLSDYSFSELGLKKLTAGCYELNKGSYRALLKADFLEEGRLISQVELEGIRYDRLVLGRVKR